MIKINLFVAVCLMVTLCYCIGLLTFLTDSGEDTCEMTYMFEYPQFVRISNKIDLNFPKYRMYAYGEGRLTAKIRNMQFDGIPVLFIPGNAGSHKQMRSLSSVALRKAISDDVNFHFDYFTLDLNHELTGLYGPLLYEQLEYVNASFYRIFELYKTSQRPNSIIVIGHSMGGIIARRLLFQIPNPNLISILITIAAPIRRPVIITDHYMETFYDIPLKPSVNSPIFVSLSGGYNDFLIPSFLSKPANNTDFIYAVTTGVPRAWNGCNHVQILWCKQIILAINRALFDAIDTRTLRVSSDASYVRSVFKHHLIHHSGIKIRNRGYYNNTININYKGKWIENVMKQYSIKHLKGVYEPHWHMVKMTSLPGYEMLNIIAINLDIVDWVYVCNANFPFNNGRACQEVTPLTHLSEIVPSIKYKRRFFQINLYDLNKNYTDLTHVVFRALPTREPLVFHVDIHGERERIITVDLPKLWSFKKQIIIEKTHENAVYYKLVLSQLYHIIQYYQLYLEHFNCKKTAHHAAAVLVTPWTDEKSQEYFTATRKKPLVIRLYNSRSTNDLQPPFVNLHLDPSCNYRVSIKLSLLGTLGQIARIYTPLLPSYVAVIILMALRFQITSLRTGNFPIIFDAIKTGIKPYYIITAVRVFNHFLKGKLPAWIPTPDNKYLTETGTDFLILPLILYLCATGFVWMLSIIYAISLFTMESTFNKLILKILNRTFVWSNYLMTFFNKVPSVVAVLLIMLSVTTCGGLALCLGAAFYFLRLTQMSQDYVEEIVWFIAKEFGKKIKSFFVKKKREEQEGTDQLQIEDSKETENQDESKEVLDDNEEVVDHKNEESENDASETKIVEENSEIVTEVGNVNEPESSDNNNDISGSLSVKFNPIFFHSTMFFLWVLIAVLNVSAVLTWARNFKYNKALSPDTSFIPGLVLTICALPLWQFDFPKTDRKWLDKLEAVIVGVAVLSLIFATVSWYRLSYLLTGVFLLVMLQQLFAPKIEETVEEFENRSDDDNKETAKEKYEDFKAKLD